MSEKQDPADPVVEDPVLEEDPSLEDPLQVEDEIDELHIESHPVEGTTSPMSDTTRSMEEDAISVKGEHIPKPFGSVATLDTIALETSPTMESLDLGETKSLDRESVGLQYEEDDTNIIAEAPGDLRDEDIRIDVSLGGEDVALGSTDDINRGGDDTTSQRGAGDLQEKVADLESDMDGVSLNDTVPAGDVTEQPIPEATKPEGTRSETPDRLGAFFGEPEDDNDRNKLSSYFAAVPSNGDNIFDKIAETAAQTSAETFPAVTSEGVPSEPVLLNETEQIDQMEMTGHLKDESYDVGISVSPSPHVKQDNEQSEPIEIIHQRHRNTSASIETPLVSFEGEALKTDVNDTQSTVSQFFSDDTGGDREGKEFFDHFTSEGVADQVSTSEGQFQVQPDAEEKIVAPEVVPKEKRKSGGAFMLPHLSPGPSPNASAYASPVHHAHVTPVPTPNATPLHQPNINIEKMPYSPQRFSNDMTGLPAFSHIPEPDMPEDVFTASLNMNEIDRQHDAWIPSDLTRQTLVSMITSQPGTFYPKQDQLTMPGLILTEPQGDPVYELLKKCFGEHEAMKRQSLSADNVPQDEEGLRMLIRAECWRSAVDLCGRLLNSHGQGLGKINIETKNTPQTLQLWFVRTALLMKLKLYSVADNENAAFGNFDKPDLFYEYYPDLYHGRKGSMVPFPYRVINAELPHFLGRSQEALDKLYYVYAIVKKIIGHLDSGLAEDGSMLELPPENRKASRDLWEKREMHILFSIVNILVGIKTYDTAVDVLEMLVKKDVEKETKVAICSGLGRLYMQMGDVDSAKRYFDEVSDMINEKDELGKCRVKMNRGILTLGQNDFESAKNYFKEVAEMEPMNAVAVNNMAVCFLYMGKLKEALQILEDLVHQNPAKYLQEGILINLCTLYELESSRALQKKQGLLELVSKYKGNGFNVSCLKMGEIMNKK